MSTAVHHDGSEIIWVTRCGKSFKASRRTVQHLDWTIARLKRRFPWARLEILQTCYHEGYEPSAGTHDFDCVFDFRIRGLTWRHGQRFLRWAGWFAWWRHTGIWAPRSAWHLHAGSLPRFLPPHPTAAQVGAAYRHHGQKVGEFIDGGVTSLGYVAGSSQVVDYMANPPRNGLADHSIDNTPRPADIADRAYVYHPWRAA